MCFLFRFLILKINYVYINLKESPVTRYKYRKRTLSDLMPIILKSVHKRWFSHRTLASLKHHVTRRTNSFQPNVLKVCLLFVNKIILKFFSIQCFQRVLFM